MSQFLTALVNIEVKTSLLLKNFNKGSCGKLTKLLKLLLMLCVVHRLVLTLQCAVGYMSTCIYGITFAHL